jgi:hypothetical protein
LLYFSNLEQHDAARREDVSKLPIRHDPIRRVPAATAVGNFEDQTAGLRLREANENTDRA